MRPGPPALLLFMVFTLVAVRGSTAAVIPVPHGGDLQAALDRARPGDVITLPQGAVFVGNFTLGAKGGADYITVKTAIADNEIPRIGNRVSPTVLHGLLARIQSPNGEPALATSPGAHHWRLVAIEFGPSSDGSGDIIRLGDGGPGQHTLESVPHDLILDRCYIHGDPSGAQKRGIALNSAATSITNSWITDIKAVGQDSQAIAGWNGPGPYAITNCLLEAAGENFMLGGADPSIDGLVPTGVTFRGNYVRKAVGWRNSAWQVKNLFELKNARAVVVENNLFEYNWQAAQAGYAILLTPRNQDGHAPWSIVQDVTIRGNVIRHVAAAINILGHDSPNSSQQARDIHIVQNLVYDVDGSTWGGTGNFLLVGDAPANVSVEHNTVLQSGTLIAVYGGSAAAPARVSGFVFRDNLVVRNGYGIKGDDHAEGTSTIEAYFPGAAVVDNVIAGASSGIYPGGNQFPGMAEFYGQFVNAPAQDFALVSSSRYLKAASDGGAVGVPPAVTRSMQLWAPATGATAKPRKNGG